MTSLMFGRSKMVCERMMSDVVQPQAWLQTYVFELSSVGALDVT